jgi:hypothetical protein
MLNLGVEDLVIWLVPLAIGLILGRYLRWFPDFLEKMLDMAAFTEAVLGRPLTWSEKQIIEVAEITWLEKHYGGAL